MRSGLSVEPCSPEASAASAIMEQAGSHAGVGCISLLTQPFSPMPRRLIRTLKPAFGSSFNVCAWGPAVQRTSPLPLHDTSLLRPSTSKNLGGWCPPCHRSHESVACCIQALKGVAVCLPVCMQAL